MACPGFCAKGNDVRPNDHKTTQAPPEPVGIVSVNDRGGVSSGMPAKIAFALLVLGIAIVGAAIGINKYRAANATPRNAQANEPAPVVPRRLFNTDPPLPKAQTNAPAAQAAPTTPACANGGQGVPLIGPDGQPMMAPSGLAIMVCADGRIKLPGDAANAVAFAPPAPTASTGQGATAPATTRKSRYDGDVMLPSAASNASAAANTAESMARMERSPQLHAAVQGSAIAARDYDSSAVSASLIGNRDMILPQGRSIDCNLSVRLVSEISGKATCVLSSNVYSDSGRVVLAERGSIATGDYVAAQGQRRLYVLWTRLQTPKGVIININSPGADALGTAGLPGYVDNRWAERIGAAFLLSMVEDAIGYETAKVSSNGQAGGAQGIAVFQSTTQTGKGLAERILDSTINIKPTIYKHQGDRATIFVSRDLDFGSVYALRAQ